MDWEVIDCLLEDIEYVEQHEALDQHKAAKIRETAQRRGKELVLERFLEIFSDD